MSDVAYGEKTFDDVADFGDNTDRVNDLMLSPTLGQTGIVRYGVPQGKRAKVNCIAVTCDFGASGLSGAYAAAQDGVRVQIRFDAVVKLEHKLNWTGLSGYIGGADDYNAENELMLQGYDTGGHAADTVISVYLIGTTAVRRMIYAELHGTLDDGTVVASAVKQAVDGATPTAMPLYMVPTGRTLFWDLITVSTRHIDLFAGKGYLVYQGMPVMVFDVMQTELGGVNGLVFPFWEMPLAEGGSLGVRFDSFECGNELVAAEIWRNEETLAGLAEAGLILGMG